MNSRSPDEEGFDFEYKTYPKSSQLPHQQKYSRVPQETQAALFQSIRNRDLEAVSLTLEQHDDALAWREFGTPIGLAAKLAFNEAFDAFLDAAEGKGVSAAADIDEPDERGWTPLMMAAKRGELLRVRRLCRLGASLDRLNNAYKWGPVPWAAFHGHLEVVRFFVLDMGAELSFVYGAIADDYYAAALPKNMTLLHCLCFQLDSELWPKTAPVAEFLLSLPAGMQAVNARMWDGRTALHVSVHHENPYVTEVLLRHGARLDIRDQLGRTPLSYAFHETLNAGGAFGSAATSVGEETHPCLAMLLRAAGAASTLTDLINTKDCYSFRPLHLAVKCGDVAAVEMLLDAGADVLAADKRFCLPIHHATWDGNVEILRLLLSSSSSSSPSSSALAQLSSKNWSDFGTPLLSLFARASEWPDDHRPVRLRRCVEELLRWGADAAALNAFDKSALDLCLDVTVWSPVPLLILAGCPIDVARLRAKMEEKEERKKEEEEQEEGREEEENEGHDLPRVDEPLEVDHSDHPQPSAFPSDERLALRWTKALTDAPMRLQDLVRVVVRRELGARVGLVAAARVGAGHVEESDGVGRLPLPVGLLDFLLLKDVID